MRRLITIFLLLCLAVLTAYARMNVGIVGGSVPAAGGPDCSGTASFIWEMNDADVTNGGCSDGDTSGTASGTPTFAAGVATYDANDERHVFTISSGDIVSSDTSTVFVRFQVTSWLNSSYVLIRIYADANDEIAFFLQSDDGMAFFHEGNGVTVQVDKYSGISTSTWYIYRLRWRTTGGPFTPDLQATLYNTNCTSQLDDDTSDTALTAFNDPATELRVGIANTYNPSVDIDYVHIYAEWRDTDPNGDCSTLP